MEYTKLEMEVIRFEEEALIVTDSNELPIQPAGLGDDPGNSDF